MEIDLQKVRGDLNGVAGKLRSQVCVIGGGIAGIVLAHRLGFHYSVTVLEAGGLVRAAGEGEDPFGAELAGLPHAGTREGRVRAFGGCSLTWGGQLLPLPDDAGWPVDSDQLRAYGANWGMPYDTAAFLEAHGARLPDLLDAMPELRPRLSYFVPFSRRNLAKRPGRAILQSRTVKVALHASALRLVFSGDRVVGVEVASPDGRRLTVAADHVVVAAGTVETCRLLLACAAESGRALGPVGANFQDHLTVSAAVFQGPARARMVSELRPWVFAPRRQARAVYSLKLEPTPELRGRLGLQPAMAHVTIEEPADSGVGALRGWLRARQAESSGVRMGAGSVRRVVAEAVRLAWEARVQHRRYVSPDAIVRLQMNMAQATPSASRIRLSSERDANGLPKAVVDWHVRDGELAGMRRFAVYMRERLEAAGVRDGAVWEPSLVRDGQAMDAALLERLDDARHAMGGACMGTYPRTSVVDPELRVHGVENLWVASAAVFPDGSAQLPTLTLSALCLRLAERLERELVR